MSESALPEDLSRWPRSPYELLGVTPGASERDLRRAYTRLIRAWKPEQFPDHFQRIRDAYETALRYQSFFGGEPEEPPVPRSPAEEVPAPLPEPVPADDLEELWRLALDGQEETAYRRFAEMDERRPGRADVAVRLYWLLAFNRDLDARRVPCDWLVHSLLNNGATGPLRVLYLRELADDPAEAETPRCDRLLELPMTAGRLADLVEARWAALAKLGAWTRLADDIETMRDRIAREDEHAWLRLVCGLADRVAWADDCGAAEVFATCRREVGRLEHLAIHRPDDFDRFEVLLRSAEGWRLLARSLPTGLLRLMPPSLTQPFAEVQPLLEEVLDQVRADPPAWLAYFSLMQKHASPVLAQFGWLLDRLQESRRWVPVRPARDVAAELAREFFAGSRDVYADLRGPLLDLCVSEAVAPEQFGEVILDRPGDWPGWVLPLAQQITDDWPLRHVYRAWALFWA
jgi:hypothetical protein